MDFNTTGEILQDINKSGKERPWKDKKEITLKAAEIMDMAGFHRRAVRMGNCGTYLKYAQCDKDGYKKLLEANFCRDRMCPMCNWRRSLKLQSQVMAVVHAAAEKRKLRYVFLTLTVANVKGDKLGWTIDDMLEGVNRLLKYKDVDKPVAGYVRTLELTYNRKSDTYHPHVHVLLGMTPTYYRSHYINHEYWTELWQMALGVDYEPVVWVQAVKAKRPKQGVEAAVVETAKYSVKDSDYIISNDIPLSVKVTKCLADATKHRRMIGFGKLFRQLHKELNLSDVESGDADLVGNKDHTCICPICQSTLKEQLYKWHVGYYVAVDTE